MTSADSGNSPGRRLLDVVFVVDCSGSMSGERIAALNWAARTVLPTMRAHAEEHPEVELRIRVLRFASGAAFATARPEPIRHFVWTGLAAAGESDMGAAFRLLGEALSEAEAGDDRLPPVIVLFSDGYPSDDAEGALETLLASEAGARAIRIPIAIGQDADMALLRRFSSDPAQPPLRSHDVEMLVGRMRWVVAGPVAKALSEATEPAHSHGPAKAGSDGKTAEDEDIW